MSTDLLEAPAPTEYKLRIADRCDKCGAQAYILASKDSFDLMFCGHHGRRFEPQLIAQGFSIHDETEKLAKQPSTDTY